MCNICHKKELVDPISVAYVITLFLQTNESCNASGIDWLYLSTQLKKCLLPNALLTKSVGFSCSKTDAVYPSKQQAWTRESCMSGMKFKRSKCRECFFFVLQFPNCQVHLDISAISTKSRVVGIFSKTNLRCRRNAAGTKFGTSTDYIKDDPHDKVQAIDLQNGWNLNDQELNYQRHCLC